MTHNGIYTKFMIEYDKANITSSYPSLTPYEIATILNKAYLALINLKLTGNNPRKVPFEYDTKSIEDLRPLVTNGSATRVDSESNIIRYSIPSGMMYYLQSYLYTLKRGVDRDSFVKNIVSEVKLISHEMSNRFIRTSHNDPWIKIPVCYLEGDNIYVMYDSSYNTDLDYKLNVTYIKEPTLFTEDSLTEPNKDPETETDLEDSETESNSVTFELSGSMAEELINLAIVFATETIESPRVQTKSSLIPLEA